MSIKMLVMDVDGTLTDGKIYITGNGEFMKAFDVKDGYGIIHLSDHGIEPVIITGRQSDIVTERARELKIYEVHQGVSDKLEFLKKLAASKGIESSEIAYIGDDENDIECMKWCGLSACPRDVLEKVKETVDYCSPFAGGNGAVRWFIELLFER